ncbi:MAG: hypothetical protein U0236_17795 [Nitrospira sp.]
MVHSLIVVFLLGGIWTQEASANPAHGRLQLMTSGERNTLFAKFLQSSGERCDSVTRNFFQGSTKSGDAIWNVTCRDGQMFAVLIYNDAKGSSKILSCATLKAINAGECFKKVLRE